MPISREVFWRHASSGMNGVGWPVFPSGRSGRIVHPLVPFLREQPPLDMPFRPRGLRLALIAFVVVELVPLAPVAVGLSRSLLGVWLGVLLFSKLVLSSGRESIEILTQKVHVHDDVLILDNAVVTVRAVPMSVSCELCLKYWWNEFRVACEFHVDVRKTPEK